LICLKRLQSQRHASRKLVKNIANRTGIQKLILFILQNRAYRLKCNDRSPDRGTRSRPLERALHSLPLASRIFRPLLFQRHKLPRHNLCFLEKLANDQRDWRYFTDF